MAFDASFDLLEPTAWNAELLANDYPMRPALANANSNIEGVPIAGQVAARNKTVKIPKATKPDGDANTYTGTYSKDDPEFTQPELTMEDVLYRSFSIDKWDQSFSLPDLVSSQVLPRMHNILDTINKNYIKRELNKFQIAVADINTNPTVMDTTDVRFMRKALLERSQVEDKVMASVIDPDGEFDLNGLSLFQEADKRGNNQIQLTGAMGNAFGFDFMLDNVPYDLSTDAAVGDAVVADDAAIGDTTITIDDGAGSAATETLADGDIIFFGTADARDEWYVVDSVNAAGTEITLKEPLRQAVTDNDAITGVAGAAQYFYDPNSIALVTAIPVQSQVTTASGVTRIPFFEPSNRVNFLISIEGDTGGADITIETLVGAKNFQESRGGRYIRGTAAKA